MTTIRRNFILIASYVFDWVIIALAAGIGGIFSIIAPNKRPFSLTNPEISFPYVHHQKISTVLLGVLALPVPAIIIFVVCLCLVPGPTVSKSTPKPLIWRRKLWEWHAGWLGLALSLAASFFITQGMKNLFGKPRPDLLSRCQPDLENQSSYAAGLVGNLVSASICQQTDNSILDDGFRSYPSGHASFSAAGLIYLSLFLASKFAITIPYLAPAAFNQDGSQFVAFKYRSRSSVGDHELQTLNPSSSAYKRHSDAQTLDPASPTSDRYSGPQALDQISPSSNKHPETSDERIMEARSQDAAPPVYLLAIALTPFFAAVYIASTRYTDFRHHGFDILFGFFIGTVTAVFAFRWYHLPISRGAGWAWGPRSKERPLWNGIGLSRWSSQAISV